jgi:hypothetical protein
MVEIVPPILCKDSFNPPKPTSFKMDPLRQSLYMSMSIDLKEFGIKAKGLSSPIPEVNLTKRKNFSSVLTEAGLGEYNKDFVGISTCITDDLYNIEPRHLEKEIRVLFPFMKIGHVRRLALKIQEGIVKYLFLL